METEESTNPETEVANEASAPEVDVENTEQVTETDTDENQEEGSGDEFEEVEVDGKVLKVSKEAKDYLLRHADYTRKTQEVAEERRRVEAEREEFLRNVQEQQEFLDQIVSLKAIDAEIQNLSNIDFQQLAAQDANQADQLWFRLRQLRDQRHYTAVELDGISRQKQAAREQEIANVREQALSELSKPDPKFGWAGKFDADTSKALTALGMELGFSQQELQATNDPRMIKALHLMRIGAEALKKQTASGSQKPQAKPVPQVGGGKSKSSQDPEKMSTEDWVKWRNAQVAKAGGR